MLTLEFVLQTNSDGKLLSAGSFLGGADQYAVNTEWHRKYDKRNSIGHRDREYSIKKPNNTFRILVLGDSMTFGHGIKKLEDTWHEKLETLLNQDSGPVSFEVISLSINGWNTDSQLYELFRIGFDYSPDMILLGYYMNDVPVPMFFDCKDEDIDFLPDIKVSGWLTRNSKAYDLIKFYGNRLLEELGQKDSYETCLNQRYESRGWDMEEIYLDTILMSAQIKNIHFMLSTIPVIHNLGDNYPLKKPHLKIKTYCTKKGIECLDLYDEGFKGLVANQLRLSKTDWHLNEPGNEIIAQTVFKKLKSLAAYQNLTKFSGAFNLNELLDQKPIITELDNKFSNVEKKGGTVEINFKNENLQVENKNEVVRYIHTISNQPKPTTYKITLDSNGNFEESEITLYRENDPNTYIMKNKVIDTRNHIIYKRNMARNDDFKVNEKIFVGQYTKKGLQFAIELFENLKLPDVKSLEYAIFGNKIDYSVGLTDEEIRNKIQSIKNNNSNSFDNLSHGLRTYLNPNKVNLRENFNILILFEIFYSLHALGYNNYILELGNEILDKKPSLTSLRVLLIYYAVTKNLEKYNGLIAEHPVLEK